MAHELATSIVTCGSEVEAAGSQAAAIAGDQACVDPCLRLRN